METLKKLILTGWDNSTKTLVYFNLFLGLVLLFVSHSVERPFLNENAAIFTIIPIILSTIVDRKTYGNLSSWLAIFPLFYFIWWFLLNLPF